MSILLLQAHLKSRSKSWLKNALKKSLRKLADSSFVLEVIFIIMFQNKIVKLMQQINPRWYQISQHNYKNTIRYLFFFDRKLDSRIYHFCFASILIHRKIWIQLLLKFSRN